MHRTTALLFPPKPTFKSAHSPLRVHCSDSNNYIIKANFSTKLYVDNGIINEFLCSLLLKEWNIICPNIAIVDVSPLLLLDSGLHPEYDIKYFSNPCFGSEVIHPVTDLLPHMFDNKKRFINDLVNPLDLIKIGLFDLWVYNLDRRPDHTNIILHVSDKKFSVLPIDHYQAFNYGYEYNQLSQDLLLSKERSILNTPLLKLIFSENLDQYNKAYWETFFEDSIIKCQNQMKHFITLIKEKTGFNISFVNNLEEFLFSNNRNSSIFADFLNFIK